ncbi:MAG TPA: tetratricopeptide repeat protein, partial [Candidatus Deferrimicrobium sp.]|nr:tetratricopeptide repeat protein [Candidatus Deferrimicrobium sp.]
EELGQWFRLLIGQTAKATKILVTCRSRFEFFPDGRDIVEGRWFHLGELGVTERLCYLNRWADLRNKTWEEKENILQAAGGHPYLLKMVLKYVQRNRDLPGAILKAAKETAAYARLDGFLSMLSPEALEWLVVAAVFPEPRFEFGIMNTRIIRDNIEDAETIEKTFQQAAEEWTALSLAAVAENEIHIDPLLIFQLLDNEESIFRQTGEKIESLRNAVGRFFLLLAGQTEERPQKANTLRLGVETVLAQGDMDLLIDYLQECADVFHGHVPGSVFADIVARVEERLLARGDERSFHTLGFCAQTLTGMRLFSKALALYLRMLGDPRMPEKYIGDFYHQIGMVYQEQPEWSPALANYQQAIEWYEKTGNHFELGGTYHQIGMVYFRQRDWSPALANYQQAIEWYEKTGNHFELGGTYHQIGRVYEAQDDITNALSFYKTGLLFSLQNKNPDAAIMRKSLARIFPKLSPEQVQTLENELGAEAVQAIKERSSS